MARSHTVPSTFYPLGTSPIVVDLDDFPGNFNFFGVRMTRENWPIGDVARVKVEWGDGTWVRGTLIGGVQFKFGIEVTEYINLFPVPRVGQGAPNIVTGKLTIEILQGITFALHTEVLFIP